MLKKLLFKESSKSDEARTNPISQAGVQILRNTTKQDPQAKLYMIEHVLAESMYIKDMSAAVQASRNYTNL